jgi:hypothetical protein
MKAVARPGKHTRQTYIHEAFPTLLYQTRYGVICFAPFQQLPSTASFRDQHLQANRLHNATPLHRGAASRPNTLTPKMTSRRREPGREAVASVPTRVPPAAALISFDPFVPAKSSRSGDILRVITRILPAKNSRICFLWISDAEVPRFTFWGVLQRPPGSRVAPIERVFDRLFDDYQRFPRSPRSPRSPPRPPPPP